MGRQPKKETQTRSEVIWYVNQYSGGPGICGGFRAYELCRRWNNMGARTAVILGSFNPGAGTHQLPAHLNVTGVDYFTIKTNRYRGNGLSRILSVFLFSFKLFGVRKSLPQDLAKPTVIILSTVHPFGIFAAKWISLRTKAKLVYEIRDFWPLTLTALLRMNKWSPLVLASGFANAFANHYADLVACVLPRGEKYFDDNGISIKRYLWVPNGASVLAQKNSPSSNKVIDGALQSIQNWRAQGAVVLVHAGAIGPPNALLEMLGGLVYGIKNDSDTIPAMLIVGDGVLQSIAMRFVKENSLDNIYFTGVLTKAETQVLIEHCDIGYAGVKDVPELYQYGVSMNKTASYLQSGIPVILPIAPCGDPVSESGFGIARACNTPSEYWQLFEDVAAILAKEKKSLVINAKQLLESDYNYDHIATRYLDTIYQLSNSADK